MIYDDIFTSWISTLLPVIILLQVSSFSSVGNNRLSFHLDVSAGIYICLFEFSKQCFTEKIIIQ